jgi:hypothetical protein
MQEVFTLSSRRQWEAALDRLQKLTPDSPDSEFGRNRDEQIRRFQQIVEMFNGLATGEKNLRGLTIESPTGFVGEIIGIRNRSLQIQQAVGAGHAQTEVALSALKTRDLLAVLRRLDPPGFPEKEVLLQLGLCDMDAAGEALRRAQALGLEVDSWAIWQEDWSQLIQDIQARLALTEIQNLIVQSRFADAAALLERTRSRWGEGQIVQRFRRSDMADMGDLIRREMSYVQPEAALPEKTSEPDKSPNDDSATIQLLTIGELNARIIAYDGRPVRVRFRARSEVDRPSRLYRTTLIGEDGQIEVLFDEAALRWVRAIPLLSLRNRDQFVYARVNAELNQLELLGRTRRLLIGHRGSEYGW